MARGKRGSNPTRTTISRRSPRRGPQSRKALEALILNRWLAPEAGPRVAAAIISELIERDMLVAHDDGWFMHLPWIERASKAPDEIAAELLLVFQLAFSRKEFPLFGACADRLLRAETITLYGRGAWERFPAAPLVDFTTAPRLLSKALSEHDLLITRRAELEAEFANRRHGRTLADFLITDASNRVAWLKSQVAMMHAVTRMIESGFHDGRFPSGVAMIDDREIAIVDEPRITLWEARLDPTDKKILNYLGKVSDLKTTSVIAEALGLKKGSIGNNLARLARLDPPMIENVTRLGYRLTEHGHAWAASEERS